MQTQKIIKALPDNNLLKQSCEVAGHLGETVTSVGCTGFPFWKLFFCRLAT